MYSFADYRGWFTRLGLYRSARVRLNAPHPRRQEPAPAIASQGHGVASQCICESETRDLIATLEQNAHYRVVAWLTDPDAQLDRASALLDDGDGYYYWSSIYISSTSRPMGTFVATRGRELYLTAWWNESAPGTHVHVRIEKISA
jgi:hypothetical protein